MRVVLDTNVFVSALLKPSGPPGRVLELILREQVTLLLDHRLIAEYRGVLARPKFGFDSGKVDDILALLDTLAEFVEVVPLGIPLRDPKDLPFLEVAISGEADALITGNKRDFDRAPDNVRVLSPVEFLAVFRKDLS